MTNLTLLLSGLAGLYLYLNTSMPAEATRRQPC